MTGQAGARQSVGVGLAPLTLMLSPLHLIVVPPVVKYSTPPSIWSTVSASLRTCFVFDVQSSTRSPESIAR